MSNTAENNKRIAKNTLMLYIRMLFTMGVSLFTSRVILQTLGVEDYGIYGVKFRNVTFDGKPHTEVGLTMVGNVNL